MSAPHHDASSHRSQVQIDHERAMGEVSDVLLNLEHCLARTKKALKVVVRRGTEPNVELALSDAIRDLDKLRKRLMQDTYFAGDSLRMI